MSSATPRDAGLWRPMCPLTWGPDWRSECHFSILAQSTLMASSVLAGSGSLNSLEMQIPTNSGCIEGFHLCKWSVVASQSMLRTTESTSRLARDIEGQSQSGWLLKLKGTHRFRRSSNRTSGLRPGSVFSCRRCRLLPSQR
jgi:hypothetical protein